MINRCFAGLGLLCALNVALAQNAPAPVSPVSRVDLLTANVTPPTALASFKSQEITLAVGVKAPLHLHPCPTVGVVLEGAIAFQIEGQAVQHLSAGQSFYEPANVRIAHFDNEGATAAKFTVFYLLGADQKETIQFIGK